MSGQFDLHGKVVVATGGRSGISLGFLRGCARQGATVVAWDLRDDGGDQLTDELTSHHAYFDRSR